MAIYKIDEKTELEIFEIKPWAVNPACIPDSGNSEIILDQLSKIGQRKMAVCPEGGIIFFHPCDLVTHNIINAEEKKLLSQMELYYDVETHRFVFKNGIFSLIAKVIAKLVNLTGVKNY